MGGQDRRTHRRLASAAEVIGWWAVAYSVWLMSLSAAPLQELLVGAAASLPCGVAAVAARRVAGEHWKLRLRWLRPLLSVPGSLLSDTAAVLISPVRRRPGGFEQVPTGAGGANPEDRSRRALATFWLSVTPGTFVVDADPGSGELMVHRCAGAGPAMVRSVRVG